MYIPRASELVNSSTSFSYDIRTRTYLQPFASKQILQRLLTANGPAMSTLKTTKQHDLSAGAPGKDDIVIQQGEPLAKLIEAGTRDFMRYGATVLDLVMEELSKQEEFPVLMAVDEFQSLYCKTEYKDPNFAGISSYHLSVPRLLMEYACGKRTFKRGAMFSATSSSPHYLVPLELEEALNMTNRLPPSPYYKRSKTLSEYAQGLLNVEVPPQLSVNEAAAVYGLWKDDKAVIPSAHDENFLARYSAASGNARDLVWKGILASLES
jgi:small subunit ribosomal protein S29